MRNRETFGSADLQAALTLDEGLVPSWIGILSGLVGRGHACHAGSTGSESRFAPREVWLPHLVWNPPPVQEANTELARRYLQVFGPASPRDLAYWMGGKVGEARRWLKALDDEVAVVPYGGGKGYLLRSDLSELETVPPPCEDWPVHLLSRFDPFLLGLKDKHWLIEEKHYKRVWRPGGHIEAILLVSGHIAGTWRYDRRTRGLAITVTPFSSLSASVREAVAHRAGEIAVFFGQPLPDLVVETD